MVFFPWTGAIPSSTEGFEERRRDHSGWRKASEKCCEENGCLRRGRTLSQHDEGWRKAYENVIATPPSAFHDQLNPTLTTLYQTTGAPGQLGFVNITNVCGGLVAFGPASPGSKLALDYTKSVCHIPYNISVLEISAPIIVPGLLDAPFAADSNLTVLLEMAECKTFASLLVSTGLLKNFQSAMDRGFTLFAPNNEAFKADSVPDLNSLSRADLVMLLQYHALLSYTPKDSLKLAGHPISTMATGYSDQIGPEKYCVAHSISSEIVAPSRSTPLGHAPAPAPGPSPSPPSPLPSTPAPALASKSTTKFCLYRLCPLLRFLRTGGENDAE
ncbi:hypothetical protein IEQ34_001804 [Dendrobium chrysotoxum]|uniref:FAS1 domain-containing protein n=1 Tax=Dendrobium chrysotoxum TaxID=161865 RepID=A0AAV7HMN8_DENCH|nr:hypothetical protein IEQ34_001804 [Dendrobium chrysotoxum]